MTIKTVTAIRKMKEAQGAILKKLIKNSKIMIYSIKAHYISYKVHLPPGVYKIFTFDMHFDKSHVQKIER